MTKPELKYEDLKVGMTASFDQLRNLYDVYVYFDNFDRATHSGVIANFINKEYITAKDDEIADMLLKKNNGLACHYLSSEVEDSFFEEDME